MAAGIAVAVVSNVVVRFMAVRIEVACQGRSIELYASPGISSTLFRTKKAKFWSKGLNLDFLSQNQASYQLDDSRAEGEAGLEPTTFGSRDQRSTS